MQVRRGQFLVIQELTGINRKQLPRDKLRAEQQLWYIARRKRNDATTDEERQFILDFYEDRSTQSPAKRDCVINPLDRTMRVPIKFLQDTIESLYKECAPKVGAYAFNLLVIVRSLHCQLHLIAPAHDRCFL